MQEKKNPSVAVVVRDDRDDGASKSGNTVHGLALWWWLVSPRLTQLSINYSPTLQLKRTGAGLWLRLEREA